MGCAASLPLDAADLDAPLGKAQAEWVSPFKRQRSTTSTFAIAAATPFSPAGVASPPPPPPSGSSLPVSPFAAVVAAPEEEEVATTAEPAAPAAPSTPPSPPPDPHARRAREVYDFGRVLGSGGFSVVRMATRKADGARFAAKVLPLPPEEEEEEETATARHHAHAHPGALARPAPSLLLPSAASTGGEPGDALGAAAAAAAAAFAAADPPAGSTRAEALREVALQARLTHPHLLRLVDWFVAPDHAVLITELAPGGALLDALLARTADGRCAGFDEGSARSVAAGLLSAVAALHAAGIAHRDIKLDNVLLGTPGDLGSVKLGDFGLATSLEGGGGCPPRPHTTAAATAAGTAPAPAPAPHHACLTLLSTLCGTPEYVAPEVLAGRGYSLPADCWSVGVCLFILLSGYTPFSGANEAAVLAAVRAAKRTGPDFDDPAWEAVSGSARGLVSRLLDPDPATRATCEEALRHPWVAGAVAAANAGNTTASTTKRAASGRPPLPSPSGWRPAALAVIAQQRLAALAASRQAAVAAAVKEGEGNTTLLGTRASAPLAGH